MGKKPKARGATRKARAQKLEDKEQSARFIETARNLGSDETGKMFSEAVNRILSKKGDSR